MLTEERKRARQKMASQAARAARRPGDQEAIDAALSAKRDYYATTLEEHIARVVDEAPPLTAQQGDRLASLLRPIPTAGGDPDAAA